MSVIRKKVTDEGMTGWCHNPKCELYPYSHQGSCQLEGHYFKCCICGKLVHTDKPPHYKNWKRLSKKERAKIRGIKNENKLKTSIKTKTTSRYI